MRFRSVVPFLGMLAAVFLLLFSWGIKAMRKTISKNDLFGSSKEEEMFTDMLDSKISEDAAADSNSGIGAMLYRQLTTNLKIDSIDKKGDIK